MYSPQGLVTALRENSSNESRATTMVPGSGFSSIGVLSQHPIVERASRPLLLYDALGRLGKTPAAASCVDPFTTYQKLSPDTLQPQGVA